MRKEFGKVIYELMKKDEKVFLLVADIGFGIFSRIMEDFPDRFINCGISEQGMIGLAAGMSLKGLKPWCYTITPFLIERPFEIIKIDLDQQKTNVKLVGYADYPDQGPTHSEVLTPSIIRKNNIFPNINCYSPKNSEQTKKAILEEYERIGPAYISLKKDKR